MSNGIHNAYTYKQVSYPRNNGVYTEMLWIVSMYDGSDREQLPGMRSDLRHPSKSLPTTGLVLASVQSLKYFQQFLACSISWLL